MLEGLKDALEHVEDLARENEKTEVVEICGHTYANKTLRRYDTANYAEPVKATTLSALADYIVNCREEFTEGRRMIIHVVSPTKVRLMSALDGERKREVLFETDAQVSGFHFDQWYDQENFMISLQANFAKTADLDAVLLLAGNIERNPGHNAVLAGLNNLSRAIGFRLDLHKEGNRVAGAGHHGLVAGPSPDQHIVCNRNILSEFKGHRIHNHVLTGKGILVPAS